MEIGWVIIIIISLFSVLFFTSIAYSFILPLKNRKVKESGFYKLNLKNILVTFYLRTSNVIFPSYKNKIKNSY